MAKKKPEHARAAAEKLLTPKELEQPKPQPKTLAEQLADIDSRAKKRAMEEKEALAKAVVKEARAKFVRLVSQTTDEEVKAAYEELQNLEKLAAGSLDHSPTAPGFRRKKEELKADAEKLVAYLEQHPNAKASDLKPIANYGLNLVKFVKDNAGRKVKMEGEKAGATYSLAD